MFIGIDLGGTKILTALADNKGRIVSSVKMETQAALGVDRVVRNITESVEVALTRAGIPMAKVAAVGIGAPGPISDNSVIVSPPNLPGWKRVDLKKMLEKALHKPVFVENDANAAALAEYRFGSGKGAKDFIFITVSTGIGGGIILNGELYRGAIGTAGEIGHMVIDPKGPRCGCGNKGCLEALAAGPAIARMAGKKDALQAEMAARKGDKRAMKAINDAGMYIGIGIANLNNLLNPDIVAVGGGISNMKELIFRPIRRWAYDCSMTEPARSLKIVPAKLKTEAGVMGAIAIAIEGACPAEALAKAG